MLCSYRKQGCCCSCRTMSVSPCWRSNNYASRIRGVRVLSPQESQGFAFRIRDASVVYSWRNQGFNFRIRDQSVLPSWETECVAFRISNVSVCAFLEKCFVSMENNNLSPSNGGVAANVAATSFGPRLLRRFVSCSTARLRI